MLILRAAGTYFALVFGTGFVLGALRVTLLLSRLGERTAELLEMPFMTVAMVLAARSVVRRQLRGAGSGSLLTTGGIALALMLGAELGVGIGLQHRSLPEILGHRDPIAGSVYLALLLLYALLPLLLSRGSTTTAVP
jgi:hypothetical protein